MQDHWGYETESKPDIVEVVRCRDCRWGRYDELLHVYWCQGITRDADFFCKFGERGESNLFTDADAMKLLERGEQQ